MIGNPLACEHANECPQTCPCGPDCYCRDHTCKGVQEIRVLSIDDQTLTRQLATELADAIVSVLRNRGVKL